MRAQRPPIESDPFERCFERNYADIARYCARRAATPDDAEEAATEVFATAWRRRHDLPAEPHDRLWLFGIARRVLANSQRSEQRRRRLTQRLRAQPAPAPVPAPSGGEDAAALAHALAALSEADRELLLLTGWEGLTPAQIARILGRPAAIVSRRLHRARRRFAAALERDPAAERSRPAPVCDLMEPE